MRISIQGDRNIRVTKALAYDFWVNTLFQHKRGMSMANAVKIYRSDIRLFSKVIVDRPLAEAVGASVEWFPETKQVRVNGKDITETI